MPRMYEDQTVTGMSQEGKTVRQKAAELDAIQASQAAKQNQDAGAARFQKAIEEALMERTPIVVGSPEDRYMQQAMDRGYTASVNEPPMGTGIAKSLRAIPGNIYDAVSSRLGNLFSEEANPTEPVSSFVAEAAAQQKESMRQDAYDTAFAKAREMGNTSENNMNSLIIQELNKRGLK
jgi:flagellar biosynthesis/type III secretory pathway protein FliH